MMDQARMTLDKNLNKFRETFQKPSCIYKYLSKRWSHSPLFLNRNLSYISNHRDNRAVKTRRAGVDEVIERLIKCKQANGKKKPNIQLNQIALPSETDCDEPKSKNSNPCFFNWICADSNRTSQMSKSVGHECPWCERDLYHLDSLMTHLRCCHPRFCFRLTQEESHPVVEITLNPKYDGSYCGFKYPGHDLRRDFRFTPIQPERRALFSNVIFIRHKRRTTNMRNSTRLNNCELYDDGEVDVDVCSGRLYYHTSTCLPIKPNEMDMDSEADLDPEWLCERTMLMIDEFTDVNEGEKEIFKLWNLHIMKNYRYKSDNMIRQACHDFVELNGLTILNKNLFRNFILHLANLYDFNLIGSKDMIQCIRRLKGMAPVASNTPSPTKCSKSKQDRNSHNEHCQKLAPAKRALLN